MNDLRKSVDFHFHPLFHFTLDYPKQLYHRVIRMLEMFVYLEFKSTETPSIEFSPAFDYSS